MEPTLSAGDRLYADPIAREIRVGDVVVLADPERRGAWLVKRIQALEPPDRVRVRGDAADRSRDSRQFGSVARESIRGVVWYRYGPAERRGPLDPPPAPS